MYYVYVQLLTHLVLFLDVYEGQTLNVIGQENGWVKINHNGQVGYVSGEFVSGVSSNAGSSNNNTNNNNQEVKPASGNYTVNVSSLRVRTQHFIQL